jgi:hypothetical protein
MGMHGIQPHIGSLVLDMCVDVYEFQNVVERTNNLI